MLNRFLRLKEDIRIMRGLVLTLIAAASFGLEGCMTPESAAQLGKSEHPKIIASYGGTYNDPALAGYVRQVGRNIATNTEPGAGGFEFTLLDTPIVNAFALPGGYTYVTRGLMALVNDEAELGGVIGHEITHVTKNHTAERYNKAQAANIGALLIGVATNSRQAMDLVGYGSQLFLLNYSRDQEFDSDKIGVKLLHKAGYDPYAMGDFLWMMGNQSAVHAKIQGKEYDPNRVDYFSTHPTTVERVSRAHNFAKDRGAVRGQGPRRKGKYMNSVNGMLYGDSPEQGFIRGRRFAHPIMKFEFYAPNGFTLQNTPVAVMGTGPNKASFQFDGASDYKSGMSLESYISQVWARGLKINVSQPRRSTVNGLLMASANARVQTKNGAVDVRLVAVQMAPGSVYRFLILSPANATSAMAEAFSGMLNSFKRLTASQAAVLKPLYLKVVTVKSGDTVTKLANRMAFNDFRVERFLALNGMKPGDVLRSGTQVKIVTE
jgi:predicted Zn-dependent protease